MTFFDEREARAVGERARAGRRDVAPEPAAMPRALRRPRSPRACGLAGAARASIRAAVEASGCAARRRGAARSTRSCSRSQATRRARSASASSSHDESPDDLRARIAAEPSDAVKVALEAKLSALERLQRRLTRLFDEMDHVVATLQTVHAEILVTDGLDRPSSPARCRVLRENVQAVAAGLEEAFAQTRSGR